MNTLGIFRHLAWLQSLDIGVSGGDDRGFQEPEARRRKAFVARFDTLNQKYWASTTDSQLIDWTALFGLSTLLNVVVIVRGRPLIRLTHRPFTKRQRRIAVVNTIIATGMLGTAARELHVRGR